MKTEYKYGALFAAIIVVYVMIEHFLGLNTTRHDIGQYTRLAGVVVPIIGVFFGIRAKRKIDLGGSLTFAQGFKAGLIVSIIQTTLTTIFFIIYGNMINPDFLDTTIAFETQKLVEAGASEAEIARQVDQLKTMYTLPVQPIFQEVFGIIYGAVFSLIFAGILRKKKTNT